MITASASDETAGRKRSAALAIFRTLLALGYLAVETLLAPVPATLANALASGLFLLYSLLMVLYHSHRRVRGVGQLVLFLDVVFLLSLVFCGQTGLGAALAAVFYAFLVLESWTQGAREVILMATALCLVGYSARLPGALSGAVSVQSVLFLLVVAGLLAFLFSDQHYLVERRINAVANRSSGASAAAAVEAIQQTLQELAGWFRCSHALLAFWEEPHEHFCLCRYPPAEAGGASLLEDSREWAVCRGERLEFLAVDVAAPDPGGRHRDPGFDLHPHLIRKFQIHNAMGCGLYQDGKPFGRLILINHISPPRPRLLRRLHRVAAAFSRLAMHLLVIKETERAAYERERMRVAQDFHDGPLQSVISFQMRVHTIRKMFDRDPAAATEELEALQEVARKQVAEMRAFVHSMRPVEIDTSSLTAAARRLAESFQKESGVPVTFMAGDQPVSVPGKISVDILQIIREALHNIHKHASATHVLLSLEENENHLSIAVNDNGKGFRFGGKYSLEELEQLRMGPNSIKQRMRALGGDLLLESQPGHGTSLRMTIPLY